MAKDMIKVDRDELQELMVCGTVLGQCAVLVSTLENQKFFGVDSAPVCKAIERYADRLSKVTHKRIVEIGESPSDQQ